MLCLRIRKGIYKYISFQFVATSITKTYIFLGQEFVFISVQKREIWKKEENEPSFSHNCQYSWCKNGPRLLVYRLSIHNIVMRPLNIESIERQLSAYFRIQTGLTPLKNTASILTEDWLLVAISDCWFHFNKPNCHIAYISWRYVVCTSLNASLLKQVNLGILSVGC